MSEAKHVGRTRLHPGHSLFCINTKTKEITDIGKPSKVEIIDGFIYRTALNKKIFYKKIS